MKLNLIVRQPTSCIISEEEWLWPEERLSRRTMRSPTRSRSRSARLCWTWRWTVTSRPPWGSSTSPPPRRWTAAKARKASWSSCLFPNWRRSRRSRPGAFSERLRLSLVISFNPGWWENWRRSSVASMWSSLPRGGSCPSPPGKPTSWSRRDPDLALWWPCTTLSWMTWSILLRLSGRE